MSLPRYEQYKDSGMEWIGEIPEGWEVKRLKYAVKINPEILPENTDKDYEIQYIDIGNVEQGQLKLPPEELKFGLAPSRARRITKYGDTIVSTVRTYLKAITYINSDLTNIICSTGFAVLRTDSNLNGKYIFYVASSPQIIEEICSLSVGVSYPAISPSTLGNISIWLPTLPEQTAIASFLDRKTAEIDQLITNKEKLIALYEEEKTAIINRAVTRGLDPTVKTKPSGVDWLGDIPEHWEVKRLKYVANMKSGEGITSDQIKESGDYPVYGGNGLRGYFDSFTHEGDYALIGRQGALCGNINYASGKFWASEHAIVCTLAGNHKVKWFGELLKTMNLNQYSVSAAQPGLSVENIKVLQVPVPPPSEQTAIVTHIETECSRLDTIIDKFKKQIELFKEYRTTLISEVVTGKIDVRGEATL